jgi:hypothetical protein
MTMAEKFALGEWLSEYPDNYSYDEILELIIKMIDEGEETENLLLWELIEFWPSEDVIELIDKTKDNFHWYLTEALKEQTK